MDMPPNPLFVLPANRPALIVVCMRPRMSYGDVPFQQSHGERFNLAIAGQFSGKVTRLSFMSASPEPTHLMDIQFVCYECDRALIAGMMPVINVCFSHIFGDFNEDYFDCETELRHGKSYFRARMVDWHEPSRHIIGESDNWGVRANGRLIWCEDSINSIDQTGWCFSLPMAAVQTLADVDEQIIDPIKVLMQGINPDEVEIPFSSNTLKFMVNDGIWEIAE